MPAKKTEEKKNLPQTQSLSKSTMLNAADVAIFTVNLNDGLIQYCNQKMCEDLRMKQEEIINQNYKDVFWADLMTRLEHLMAQSSTEKAVTGVYYWKKRIMWVLIAMRTVQQEGNAPVAVVTVTNVTSLSMPENDFEKVAYYDPQMGIANGRQLEKDVAELDDHTDVALVHFDIDKFSTVNEVYGWDTGDYVLEQIRDWIMETAKAGNRLYRMSEDEFAILIRHTTLANAKRRARQILARFKQGWRVAPDDSRELYCNITMSVVYGKYVEGDVRNTLSRTVIGAGKSGGFTLYDAKMDQRIQHIFLIRQTLVNSLQNQMQGFSIQYQPIVNPYTGNWVGAEALSRWGHPQVGRVSPVLFINQLEQLGLIEQLDNWVLETAVKQCTEWGLDKKEFMLDVNMSPLQGVSENYVAKLMKMLDKYKYPRNKLCLEITESNKFKFTEHNMETFRRLRGLGVCIALDDFGTGYSNFENLMRMPAYLLKTEKSFIDSLESDPYQQYLLRMMVELAHTAGLKVVSEGVETEGQKRLLMDYGVDYLQGYLFSKPLTVAQMGKCLHHFKPQQ